MHNSSKVYMHQINEEAKMNNSKYGIYGGQYVPEILMPALQELEEEYSRYRNDPQFQQDLNYYLRDFAGRETPLYYARNLSRKYKTKIYLKREDLVHGGAHKLNNTLGQALLAKYMGKKELLLKPVPDSMEQQHQWQVQI